MSFSSNIQESNHAQLRRTAKLLNILETQVNQRALATGKMRRLRQEISDCIEQQEREIDCALDAINEAEELAFPSWIKKEEEAEK